MRRGIPALHTRQFAQIDRADHLAVLIQEVQGETIILRERLQRLPVEEEAERGLRHLRVTAVKDIEADELQCVAEQDVGAILRLVEQRAIRRLRNHRILAERLRQRRAGRTTAQKQVAVLGAHQAELIAGHKLPDLPVLIAFVRQRGDIQKDVLGVADVREAI